MKMQNLVKSLVLIVLLIMLFAITSCTYTAEKEHTVDIEPPFETVPENTKKSEHIEGDSERILVRFYEKTYFEIMESSVGRLLEDTYQWFERGYGIKVRNVWYEENKICIDFDSASIAERTTYYSKEDIDFIDTSTELFVKTLSSYPDVEEIEFLIDGKRGVFGNQSVYPAFKPNSNPVDWDTAEVKFYLHPSRNDPTYQDESIWEYKTEYITYANLVVDTIRYMKVHNEIEVINIWYENTRLFVDLDAGEYRSLDAGSSAAWEETQILVRTFSSYPGVEEIEFLINSEKNCGGSHFRFDVVYLVY